MDNLKIGLFGFGCVGQGVYDIIQEQSLPIEILGICVKDQHKIRSISSDRFTYDPQVLLKNPEIEIIVELIDDAEDAFAIVKQALLAGKKVVTANKKMVAEHFEELLLLKNNQNILRYEAAVCGSIPIVATLDSFYAQEPLHGVAGIFNGSSNFILSKIEKEGLSYDQALSLAQELGFAESDPKLDVGGFDSLNKLVILLAHGFGISTTPNSLLNLGIQNLVPEDLSFASTRGLKIKLLAKATMVDQQVHAYVMPGFVNEQNALWNVDDEFNAVLVKGQYSDTHLYTGKGAGSHPTAASVIADMHAVAQNKQYEYFKLGEQSHLAVENEAPISVFLRYNHPRQLQEFEFIKTWSEGRYKNGGFVLGAISLSQMWSLQTYIEDQGITIIDTSLIQESIERSNGVLKKDMVY